MSFTIRMGVPEMQDLWDDLHIKSQQGKLNKGELKLWKKLAKCICLLSSNPWHNSLHSHEIAALTKRYSKLFSEQSKTPAAGRLFWVYGPARSEITVIGLEPHPEDQKKGGYSKVRLSDLPPL